MGILPALSQFQAPDNMPSVSVTLILNLFERLIYTQALNDTYLLAG